MTEIYIVRLARDAMVVHVWEAVKREYGDTLLRGVVSSDLLVFSSKGAFAEQRRMRAGDSIDGIGLSSEDPIVVQAPPPLPPLAPQVARPSTGLTLVEAAKPKLRWKPAPDLVPSLEDEGLHFVNQDDAVKQLCKVHQSWFNGATRGRRRGVWRIPLADNELGLGKTEFGRHYIQRCIEDWPAECKAAGFQESLRACRTLRIVVERHDFAQSARITGVANTELLASHLAATITDYLVKAIKRELDLADETPLPGFLTSPTTIRHGLFLANVVEEIGPIFVVLDEIGQGFAFSDSPDYHEEEKSRDLFLVFCRSILSTWMNTPGVYFVLMGFAPFLRNVSERKDYLEHKSSPFEITRLNLQLMRPKKIEEILVKTWVDSSKTQTLAQRWGLVSESQIEQAAQIIYQKTCGHPRRMVRVLTAFEDFDSFSQAQDIAFRSITSDGNAYDHLHRQLRKGQSVLEDWFPSILDKAPIDLSDD